MLIKPLGTLFGFAFGLAALATPLAAQEPPRLAESQWYLSPMGSLVTDDPDRFSQNGPGLHLGVGRGVSENWLMEINYAANWLKREINEEEQWSLSADFLRQFAGGNRVQPYWLVGAGYLRSNIQEGTVNGMPAPFVGDPANFMNSFGLGMMTRMGSSNIRFRAEVRARVDYRESTESDLIINLGVVIPQKLKVIVAAADLDSDQDGVSNSIDECPGTPLNANVDAKGCPNDSDGDGVTDNRDKCPDTPQGITVDMDGCPLDGDQDGVLDQNDDCLNSAPGAPVDVRGCEFAPTVDLPGVTFEPSSAILESDSSETLDKVVLALRKYMDMRVEVAGHTDSSGNERRNQTLSEQRAEAVRKYLIDNGISADRITARGYGSSQPVADNVTQEGKKANRRVALNIQQ